MDWDMNQELLAESEEQSDSASDSVNESLIASDDYDDDEGDEDDDDDDDDDDEDEDEGEGEGDDDFKILTPLLAWDDDSGNNCDNSSFPIDSVDYNAHGVVHVRLLRARNLPCPIGSSVRATVSLEPYKGKIQSARTKAFSSISLDHGVCVKWENERQKLYKNKKNTSNTNSRTNDEDCSGNNFSIEDEEYMENYDGIDDDNFGDNDDDNLLSMVNGWSGPNSPVPSIRIDLTFSPLGIGIFDFTMASVELSTTVLLKRAGLWRRRWCTMEVANSSASQANYHDDHKNDSFIRIQALFVPSISSTTVTQKAASMPPKQFITVPPIPLHLEGALLVENETDINDNNTDKQDNINHSSNLQPEHQLNVQTMTSSEQLNDYDHLIRQSNMHEESKINDNGDDCCIEPLQIKENYSSFWDSQELSLPGDAASSSGDASTVISRKTTTSQMAMRDAASLRCPHLLRAQTYWAPSNCVACGGLLMGIFKNGVGFRCEVCRIDCCGDCRLHVDLRVPCGSDLASEIVEGSFRNKLSALGLLSYVAPDKVYLEKRRCLLEEEQSMQRGKKYSTSSIISSRRSLAMSTNSNNPHSPLISSATESNTMEGIGRCRFEIVTACLFLQNARSMSLRKGDYYVRISTSDSDKSARTPTLQKTGGMPHFQSAEMRFSLSHYGVQFRIDVVEADTDTIVGSVLLTTQGILQTQRDSYIAEHGVSLIQFLKGPIPWMGKRKMKLKLRSGIKGNACTDDFFSLPTPNRKGITSKSPTVEQSGSVSGWIDIFVGVEEFYSRLYGPNPIECPRRPPAALNMGNFSNYIGRITAIIEELSHGLHHYKHVVSWDDPLFTAISLCIFILFCLRFNAEYSGSLPILFFIMVLIYLAVRRTQGKIKSSYIRKEVEIMQKVEGNAVGYTIYRPRGTIRVRVTKGRNLLSPELGIAGNTSCTVTWDSVRFAADDQMKEYIVRSDKSAHTPLEIGNTSTLYTADPNWTGMEESGITKRLNQLLPSTENDFFEPSFASIKDNAGIEELAFPILQPFEITCRSSCDAKLKAWESSKGAIVLQVKFPDFFNNLPGFDQVLGEVIFPFCDLAREREIKGWFQILDVGTTSTSLLEDHEVEGEDLLCGMTLNPPRVYVHIRWDPPLISMPGDPNDDEKEISHAIQEELVRSSILSKDNKFNLVDSSIGAVNRALGIGGTVQVFQNTLGSILDVVEGVINILNFTDPFKSSTIFVGLMLIWLVFVIIPTRHIVLLSGLAQYGVTFCKKYGQVLRMKFNKKSVKSISEMNRVSVLSHIDRSNEMEQNKNKCLPFLVWITNAIRSIPTNEDLRKAYFWESRQLGSEKAKKYALEKRESRLKKLWKAEWHCSVSVLVQDKEINQWHQASFHWELGCFAVVQGHRFIWWKSVDDFDDGEIPAGKVMLSGHFGLAGPSPIEMRELDVEKELPLSLTIFGRGTTDQQRITMLLPNKRVKEDLENAVIGSASFKSD